MFVSTYYLGVHYKKCMLFSGMRKSCDLLIYIDLVKALAGGLYCYVMQQ